MKAPRLEVQLALEAQREEPDGAGGLARLWETVGQVWAEMHAGSGGLHAAGVGAGSVVSWRIIVRAARPGDARRPRAGQRFCLGRGGTARHFSIGSVAEADPAGRYLLCLAKEEGRQ